MRYWTLSLFVFVLYFSISTNTTLSWQVCGQGGFPHIFLALIWAMPVSMPVLCLESHSQTLPVKVTKWPSSSTMHVRDMQALWHASGWGWGWFVYPRANSKTLNLIPRAASEYFTLHPEKKLQFLTLFYFKQFTLPEKMPGYQPAIRLLQNNGISYLGGNMSMILMINGSFSVICSRLVP